MDQLSYLEINEENEQMYLSQIVDLELKVLKKMEEDGKIGQLFITGEEGISEYIHSTKDMVMVAVNENGKVVSATYITQGQKPFTYNDITKYFKYGNEYIKYIKSKYSSPDLYKKDMFNTYKVKIEAFSYAKKILLTEFNQYNGDIIAFLQHELDEQDNGFHEKSILRDKLNQYMSDYIEQLEKTQPGVKKLYEQFYWTTLKDIEKEFQNDLKDMNITDTIKEYEKILDKSKLKIHEIPSFDQSIYYSANTENSIEIDSYITDTENRNNGLARIIVYECLKKKIIEQFEKQEQREIFLCSTLHRENVSSKYVSEFFGLRDNLFVRRRYNIDREVHICKISIENYKEYIKDMEEKLAVLYKYNPNKISILIKKNNEILQEQMDYEIAEINRLMLKENSKNIIESKERKIKNLKSQMIKFDKIKKI